MLVVAPGGETQAIVFALDLHRLVDGHRRLPFEPLTLSFAASSVTSTPFGTSIG